MRTESADERVYMAADKNRYFKLATYLSHLSLILFVLAYIIGSSFGFRDTGFVVAEGGTRDVGHSTGLSLHLISFVETYYPDNTPKDYRSEVTLMKNGVEVRQALIRVNHPLTYGGVRFYQSFFGRVVKIELKQNGAVISQGNVPLVGISTSQGYERYVGDLDLPEQGLSLRVVSSAINAPDPMIPAGQVALVVSRSGQQIGLGLLEEGKPVELAGIDFTYLETVPFSGFQVSRDPGNLLIWIASSLFIIGVTSVLYFTHRQIWVLVDRQPTGQSRTFIRAASQRVLSPAADIEKLVAAIEKTKP